MSGHTELDKQVKCVKLCQEHFGGAWNSIQTHDQVKAAVKSVSGGFNNFLYVISLPEGTSPEGSEPSRVMLRFYGAASGDHNAILKDSLVFALLSEKGLGPRLYGCFAGGRFEEYIPTRSLRTHELAYPKYMQQIATRMAKFHLLDMPLSKEPRYLRDKLEGFLKSVLSGYELLLTKYPEQMHQITSLHLNLTQETQWLLDVLYSYPSPVRFCHNDVHEGNLLLTPETDELVLIDFEYAAYNFRGYDVANHFVEWCYCYAVSESPYFSESLENYPSYEQQSTFFKIYLTACGIPPEQIPTEMEAIYDETQLHVLGVHFLWALWSLIYACNPPLEFDYMNFAFRRLQAYLNHKEYLKLNHPKLFRISHTGDSHQLRN